MAESNEFTVAFIIPLTVFTEKKMTREDVKNLQAYLERMLNEPESDQRPRKAFYGELFHFVLLQLAQGVGSCMEGDAYFKEMWHKKDPPGIKYDKIHLDFRDATKG